MNERVDAVAIQSLRRVMDELTEYHKKPRCPECEVHGDHTWWCKVAPEVLPDGTRPYYWRD